MDRGAWQAVVHRVARSQTQLKRFSTHTIYCSNRDTFVRITGHCKHYARSAGINWNHPGQTGIHGDTEIETHDPVREVREDFLGKETLGAGL